MSDKIIPNQQNNSISLESKDGRFGFTEYVGIKKPDGTMVGHLRGIDYNLPDGRNEVIAVFKGPDTFPDKQNAQAAFLKENLQSYLQGAEIRNFKTELTAEVFDNELRKAGATVHTEKIHTATGNEGNTTLHINKENGAVHSAPVHEQHTKGALSKGFNKLGIIGGAAAAGIAMASGANASEIAAAAIPGGQSVLSGTKGNYFEAILQGIEETGVGTILTEAVRPVARAFGANVESGMAEDLFNGARNMLNDPKGWSNGGIENEQKRLLTEAGFPEKVGNKPIAEALRDPEISKQYQDMMVRMENPAGLEAMKQSGELDKILQDRAAAAQAQYNPNAPTYNGMMPGQII